MTKKLLTAAAIALACTNFANAGTHGGHAQATTPGHSSGNIYDNMYVTLFGGVTMPKKFTGHNYKEYSDPKNDFTFGAGVGYHVDRNIRTELTIQKLDFTSEVNYPPTNTKNKYENLAVFANGYFDLVTFNKLTPYLTAGAGFSNTKLKFKMTGKETGSDEIKGQSCKSKSKSNFAWNIGAGFRHDFRDNITLDIGYKYIDLGSHKSTINYDDLENRGKKSVDYNTKLNAHTFNVGVAYNF